MSENAVSVEANKLFNNPNVSLRLEELQKELEKENNISRGWVLKKETKEYIQILEDFNFDFKTKLDLFLNNGKILVEKTITNTISSETPSYINFYANFLSITNTAIFNHLLKFFTLSIFNI